MGWLQGQLKVATPVVLICPLTEALKFGDCVKGCGVQVNTSPVLQIAAPQPLGPYLGLSVGPGNGTP